MKYRKTIIIGLAILLLIDLGLVYQSYQDGKAPDFETIEVKKGDIAQKVSVTGTVSPASSLDLQFTSSGRVAAVNVKVGDSVRAGQVLVSLDSSDLSFQAQAQAAALKSSEARLSQLLAGASQEDIALAQTAVANAEKSLDDANKSLVDSQASAQNSLADVFEDWQRTLQASFLTSQNSIKSNVQVLDSSKIGSNSIADSQALIDADGLRQNTETEYSAAKILIDKALSRMNEIDISDASAKSRILLPSVISALSRTYDALNSAIISSSFSQADLDDFKADIIAARTNANTALTNLVTSEQAVATQKITNQINLTSAQTKVTSAQGSLKSSQDQLILKTAAPRQVDIDLKQAEIAQALASLNQIRNQIAQKILVAPIDGVATSVDIEKEEIASLGKTVVSMDSLSDFEIKSDIAESDIAKVKVGDSVSINFDAFGESEEFNGKVIKIDPAQTIISGVVYYKTTIGLLNPSGKIKPRNTTSASSEFDPAQRDQQKLIYGVKSGMTANLEIETVRHAGALILPLRAILDNGTEKSVKYLNGENIAEKKVETGIRSDQGEIEILAGVKEGEKVIIEK